MPDPVAGSSSTYSGFMDRLNVSELHCYGCAHSDAGEKYPGRPSGERPCQFCIRNRELADPPTVAKWYDQSDPVRVPMDAYTTLDMRDQVMVWVDAATRVTPEEVQAVGVQLRSTRDRLADGA